MINYNHYLTIVVLIDFIIIKQSFSVNIGIGQGFILLIIFFDSIMPREYCIFMEFYLIHIILPTFLLMFSILGSLYIIN